MVRVFICHAGEQKQDFADLMHAWLTGPYQLSVFLDEHSLEVGEHAPSVMLRELTAADVAVVVISKDFVCKTAPMQELHELLRLQQDQPGLCQICPVFYDLTVDACGSRQQLMNVYDSRAWAQEQRPSEAQLEGYIADLSTLCEYTGLRLDQARQYYGKLANQAVSAFLRCLIHAGKLPKGYTIASSDLRRYSPHSTLPLFGREAELKQVMAGLHTRRCVIVKGAPGEGKTALVDAAARQLQREDANIACVIDVSLSGVAALQEEPCLETSPLATFMAQAIFAKLYGCCQEMHRRGWTDLENCLQRPQQKPVLILLEDVEQAHHLWQDFLDLLHRLHRLPVVRVLVGSRIGVDYEAGCVVPLGSIPLAAAVQLLAYITDGCWTAKDVAAATQIARLMHCNPLVLTVVGGFINNHRFSLQDAAMQAEMEGLNLEHGAKHGGLTDNFRMRQVPAWLTSYLKQGEILALARLSVFQGSFAEPAAVHMGIGSASQDQQADTLDATRARRLLSCMMLGHLVSPVPPSRFSMHLLVQHYAQDQLAKQPHSEQHSTQGRFIDWMLSLPELLKRAQLVPVEPAAGDGRTVLAEVLVSELRNLRALCNLPGLGQHASFRSDQQHVKRLRSLVHDLHDHGHANEAEMLRVLLPMGTAPGAKPDVFFCHAGTQAGAFVDVLDVLLTKYHGVAVAQSHAAATNTMPGTKVDLQLAGAAVAVVVLSRGTLAMQAALAELRRLLLWQAEAAADRRICLLFNGISAEECCSMDMPAALQDHKVDLETLRQITGDQKDETCCYQGEQACEAVEAVIQHLMRSGRLAAEYQGGPRCRLRRVQGPLLGRLSEMQGICTSLQERLAVAIVAGPGEGKSVLAAEIAVSMFEKGSLPGGAYSLDLLSLGEGMPLCELLAYELMSQIGNLEAVDMLTGSSGWQKLLLWLKRNKRDLLLVLENAEANLMDGHASKEALMEVISGLSQCRSVRLLVTSRVPLGGQLDLCTYKLGPLNQGQARELLYSLSGDVVWEAGQADELAALCGYNALALTIVASMASRRCIAIEAASKSAAAGQPLSLLGNARMDEACDHGDVQRAHAWLLDCLTQQEKDAVLKLSLFRGSISLDSMQLMLGVDGHSRVIQALQSRRLLQQTTVSAANRVRVRFTMHPVIRDLASRAHAAQPHEHQAASWQLFLMCVLSTTDWLLELSPSRPWDQAAAAATIAGELQNFKALRRGLQTTAGGLDISSDTLHRMSKLPSALHAHGLDEEAVAQHAQVLKLMQRIQGRAHPDTLRAMVSLSSAWKDLGRYEEAAKMYRQVLQLKQEVLGPEHIEVLSSMDDLAGCLFDMALYAGVAEQHRQLLELRQKILGPEHPATLGSMNNLASCLSGVGRVAEAAEQLGQVLELRQKVLGPEHTDTLSSMHSLASCLADMGQHAEAAEQHKHVLQLMQKVLGPEHPDTLISMDHMASQNWNLGRHAEAAEQITRVLELKTKVLGPEHPDTLNSMLNLASCLSRMGRHAEAGQQMWRVLELRRKVLGPEDPDTLSSMHSLASCLFSMGQHAEAAEQNRRVLELRQKVLGPEHPDTLSSRHGLAGCLSVMGQHAEAAEQNRRVFELRQKVLGPEHPETLSSMDDLAGCLSNMGQHAKALVQNRGVLELRQKVLGPEHPDTLSSMNDLTVCLAEMGQHAEAAEQHMHVLKLRQKVPGPEHPNTLSSMSNLGIALSRMGQHEQAALQHTQALELMFKLLGPEHPGTFSSMSNLASCLSNMGQHAEAAQMHRRVLEVRQKVLGPEHPNTLSSMSNLAGCLPDMGQHAEAAEQHGRVLELRQKVLGPEHPDTLSSLQALAAVGRRRASSWRLKWLWNWR